MMSVILIRVNIVFCGSARSLLPCATMDAPNNASTKKRVTPLVVHFRSESRFSQGCHSRPLLAPRMRLLPSRFLSRTLTTRHPFLIPDPRATLLAPLQPTIMRRALITHPPRPPSDEVIEDSEPEREERRRELQSRRKVLCKSRHRTRATGETFTSAVIAHRDGTFEISGSPPFSI